MSVIKKYKKEVQENNQTNLEFSQIKNKINMKKAPKKQNNWWIAFPSIGAAALACGIAFAFIFNPGGGVTPGGNTITPGSQIKPGTTGGNIVLPSDKTLSPNALAKTATPLVNSLVSTSQTSIKKMPLLKLRNDSENNKEDSTTTVENNVEEQQILDLLAQFDTIIENDNNYVIEQVESSDPLYKFQENISFKDLVGASSSYSLFYNDVVIKEEQDEEEIEKKTEYSGIAKFEEQSFDFTIKLSEESEEDEVEIKSEFYLYTSTDHKTYTKVTCESEVEALEQETEYSYEVYENGKKVQDYSLEIEYDENNKVELEIEVNKTKYKIVKREYQGETYFDVKYKAGTGVGSTKYTYKKVVTDGVVSYELVK